MNKWVVGLEVCLIIIVLTYPLQTRAFVSVDGYFRNDGTYVESHVRSEPNAFTFDNYSWTPDQGLYNDSYVSPSQNYSSDWYTPSYITDSYYNLGNDLYKGNNSIDSYSNDFESDSLYDYGTETQYPYEDNSIDSYSNDFESDSLYDYGTETQDPYGDNSIDSYSNDFESNSLYDYGTETQDPYGDNSIDSYSNDFESDSLYDY